MSNRYKTANSLTLFILGSSLLLMGCTSQSPRHTYGHTGWNSSAEESVPGIDQAMIRWYARGEDLVYVVWTDLPGGGGTSGGTSTTANRNQERQLATIETSDGTPFQFEFLLDPSEKLATGDLVIASGRYDTQRGRLLLVSSKAKELEVKQIDIPTSIAAVLRNPGHTQESLQTALRDLAQKETELSGFFGNKEM